ncbi:TfuA-like protein [Desulfovibrio inopinatus]|uniref:TfuA-like protein n=1 Tax=Desulfovibrio inopinatus TaxID=102109 RepID=UPI0003FF3BAF|nr:TfuA-like protein [Desulfovibrio inopinatus]
MNTFVFLGPSLPRQEAQALLAAHYQPPAGQGDVLSLLQTRSPDAIVIIDLDPNRFTLWAVELIHALEIGVRVYGAGAGALLAAELQQFGASGVGQTFSSVMAGQLLDDDFVYCAHHPEQDGFARLSEPMVNLQETLKQTETLSPDERTLILAAAQKLPFRNRTLERVVVASKEAGLARQTAKGLALQLRQGYVDVMANDARALLVRVAQEQPVKGEAKSHLERQTLHFCPDMYARVQRRGAEVSFTEIAAHAVLNDERFWWLSLSAFNQAAVAAMAEHFKMSVTEAEQSVERTRFLSERGLSEAKLSDWLRDNDMRQDEFDALMQQMTLCRKMQAWFLSAKPETRGVRELMNQFRITGLYAELADATAREKRLTQEAEAQASAQHKISFTDVGKALLSHFQKLGRPLTVNPKQWLESCGMPGASLAVALYRAGVRQAAELGRRSKDEGNVENKPKKKGG